MVSPRTAVIQTNWTVNTLVTRFNGAKLIMPPAIRYWRVRLRKIAAWPLPTMVVTR